MLTLALILQDGPDPEQMRHIILGMMAVLPFIILIGVSIIVIPFWFICKKAGFSPWLSLINLIPLGNLILIYVLAFADWKTVPVPTAWQAMPPPPAPPAFPPQG